MNVKITSLNFTTSTKDYVYTVTYCLPRLYFLPRDAVAVLDTKMFVCPYVRHPSAQCLKTEKATQI